MVENRGLCKFGIESGSILLYYIVAWEKMIETSGSSGWENEASNALIGRYIHIIEVYTR